MMKAAKSFPPEFGPINHGIPPPRRLFHVYSFNPALRRLILMSEGDVREGEYRSRCIACLDGVTRISLIQHHNLTVASVQPIDSGVHVALAVGQDMVGLIDAASLEWTEDDEIDWAPSVFSHGWTGPSDRHSPTAYE